MVLLFVFTGMLLGFVLGEFMPWRDADKLLAFNFWNYWQPFMVFVLPNLFFTGVIFFMLGALSRKMVVVYSSWIFLFILYQIGTMISQELDNRDIAALLDPFSLITINTATQYWTVTEQNGQGCWDGWNHSHKQGHLDGHRSHLRNCWIFCFQF